MVEFIGIFFVDFSVVVIFDYRSGLNSFNLMDLCLGDLVIFEEEVVYYFLFLFVLRFYCLIYRYLIYFNLCIFDDIKGEFFL